MTTLNIDAEHLKTWTCNQCGATLPRDVDDCGLVTCKACGTTLRLPESSAQAGGVLITGGSVVVHGDVVGRDLVFTRKSQGSSVISRLLAKLKK